MKKNKTYKRFDSQTYRMVMSILIYLESIDVTDIVRHVNHSKVYYRVRIDASFIKLDSVSNIMENLPKRYVVAFDTFMGKVFKRVMRRVHTFYRDEYYTISFLMDYLQANSYIVPIGLDDIDCIRMYVENKYDKGDVLKLVDNLLAKKSEVENILDNTEVVNKNTTLDTETLDKNFVYLKETLLRLYMKGYNTIEVGDNIIAVVQDYTQNEVDNHTIKRKTYLNITSTFDLLDLYRPLRRGVYSIKDILNLPNVGDIVYMGDKPYYLHSISSNDVGTQYFLYPNHLNKEMYELLGRPNSLEMTYKVRLTKKNNTCNMFTDGYQEEWDRFIGGL
jgi:hypothetical protein|nr:MAG TPA: hypothetical protein [Bacteriophage sp.]